jgi:hypothetical protein
LGNCENGPPSDRLKTAKAANPNQKVADAWVIHGEGPIEGFDLDLKEIWAGL